MRRGRRFYILRQGRWRLRFAVARVGVMGRLPGICLSQYKPYKHNTLLDAHAGLPHGRTPPNDPRSTTASPAWWGGISCSDHLRKRHFILSCGCMRTFRAAGYWLTA